jgi:hypothetical protein
VCSSTQSPSSPTAACASSRTSWTRCRAEGARTRRAWARHRVPPR